MVLLRRCRERARGHSHIRGRGSARSGRGGEGRSGRGRGDRSERGIGSRSHSGRGRGRGRGGRGTGRSTVDDGLSEHQRKILVNGWKKQENVFTDFPFNGATPGPTTPAAGASASECFGRFFTDEVWDLLVEETNRYAAQVRSTIASPNARPWHDIDRVEMKAFVGMLMAMGLCKLPRLEMYWSTACKYTTPGLRKVMPLVRFHQIWRFFHLCDSSKQVPRGQPGYDVLYKVRPPLDLVSPKLESEYNLHEHVSIDEAMIKYKGRLGFKQYMKAKPTKWGIKVFVLSDATNGYVSRFQVYTGKNSTLSTGDDHGLCTKAVLSLRQGIEDKSYKLFVDNYYTSPVLFLTLYNKKVLACGTARTNRKYYPKELRVKESGKERGWYDYLCSPPLLACVWKDRRIINFLTTMHKAEGTATVNRTVVSEGEVTREQVSCPPLLPDYQAFMRGVDRADQLMGYYNVSRRSKKWWKRVFGYVVEVASLNAYIIQRDGRPPADRKKHDYLEFRLQLAEELIGSFTSRTRAVGRPRSLEHQQAVRLDSTKNHLPVFSDVSHDCEVCSRVREVRNLTRSQYRHETKIKCMECDVSLCVNSARNCYVKYHTAVRYWE